MMATELLLSQKLTMPSVWEQMQLRVYMPAALLRCMQSSTYMHTHTYTYQYAHTYRRTYVYIHIYIQRERGMGVWICDTCSTYIYTHTRTCLFIHSYTLPCHGAWLFANPHVHRFRSLKLSLSLHIYIHRFMRIRTYICINAHLHPVAGLSSRQSYVLFSA